MSIYETGGPHSDISSPVEIHARHLTFDHLADRIERRYALAQIAPTGDFDPYSHHNDNKPDPIIEKFADISLNTPLPDKVPGLTATEVTFAQEATEALKEFAKSFPKPESVDALNDLTKMFKDKRVRPDVVDAINMFFDQAHLDRSVHLGYSPVTGLICLGTADGDGHYTKRFWISDNRRIKR